MQPIEAEALLAAIGLGRFLEDGRPIALTIAVQEAAQALAFRWRRQIRRFIRQDGAPERAAKPATAKEVMAVVDALTAAATPEQVSARLGDVPPEIAEALITAATVALEVARAALPLRPSRQTLLGADLGMPSATEISKFRHTWGVLDDPGVVLDDLGRLRLTIRQARALRDGYPGLYGMLATLAVKELADYRADRPRAELPRVREMQMRTLLGMTDDPARLRLLQSGFVGPDPTAEPGMPAGGGATSAARVKKAVPGGALAGGGLQTGTQQSAGG